MRPAFDFILLGINYNVYGPCGKVIACYKNNRYNIIVTVVVVSH
jgi:hypothetical protein